MKRLWSSGNQTEIQRLTARWEILQVQSINPRASVPNLLAADPFPFLAWFKVLAIRVGEGARTRGCLLSTTCVIYTDRLLEEIKPGLYMHAHHFDFSPLDCLFTPRGIEAR